MLSLYWVGMLPTDSLVGTTARAGVGGMLATATMALFRYLVSLIRTGQDGGGDPEPPNTPGLQPGLGRHPIGPPDPPGEQNRRRSAANRFWAWDRAMGGQRRPTRIQKWVARHPVGTGLCTAVFFTLFFLLLSLQEPNALVAVIFGLLMGLVFGLTAISERLRQRRLKRLGMWD
ncbi:hypothetical protein [Kitasatospora sp. NPDC057541]|uniref:hypothetical protein n=1 Tax=unclassified Kitasatospora TaxID=2633591 RepID=UPI0036C31B82